MFRKEWVMNDAGTIRCARRGDAPRCPSLVCGARMPAAARYVDPASLPIPLPRSAGGSGQNELPFEIELAKQPGLRSSYTSRSFSFRHAPAQFAYTSLCLSSAPCFCSLLGALPLAAPPHHSRAF